MTRLFGIAAMVAYFGPTATLVVVGLPLVVVGKLRERREGRGR